LARDGSGLEIPVAPVMLLVKKMLRGDLLPPAPIRVWDFSRLPS
jgi:hypothetical protein